MSKMVDLVLDLVLKDGEVLDPSQDLRARRDIVVRDGTIAQVAPTIRATDDAQVVDVSGKLVVPGLIDLHTHVYEGVNQNGINPDIAGVRSGVTTVVDAGSTGCYTFGNTINGDTALVPVLTVKAGESFTPDWGPRPWGWLPLPTSP